jgi:kinetochore protein Spc25, fungi type
LERKTLDAQRAHVPEELRIFERALGCVIEGVGPDQLLIRYVLKDAQGSRSTHEASFVLDVSSTSYKGTSRQLRLIYLRTDSYFIVVTSTPLLPTLRTLLDQLNETLDIYTFIKHMREAYVKLFS